MSTKSAVHIASVPEATTLLIFFRIGLCSSSASSLLHSTPQPSLLFVPIIVRTSSLSILSRMPFGSSTSSSFNISSSHACFPPSYRCSRYRDASIYHPRCCTAPVQSTVDHTHQAARAVDYTVQCIYERVTRNPSSIVEVYQLPCVYPSLS